MKRFFLTLPWALAGLACCAAGAAWAAPRGAESWVILEAGVAHAGESPAQPGTGWLALRPVNGLWHLVPTQLAAARVRDEIADSRPEERTGVEITAAHADALVLLRHPLLSAGKVDTPNMKFVGKRRRVVASPAAEAQPVRFTFGAGSYVISGRAAASSGEGAPVLIEPGPGQPLARLEGLGAYATDSEQGADLVWAGDLDHDGKPDLIMASQGSNSGGVCLYLSSRPGGEGVWKQALSASPGAASAPASPPTAEPAWRPVACHVRTGC